jgi:NAD+ diphosphatase
MPVKRDNLVGFEPGIVYKGGDAAALWFLFHEGKLLIEEQEGMIDIPRISGPDELNLKSGSTHYLGTLGGVPCYCAEVCEESRIPEGLFFQGLRELINLLDDEIFRVAGLASQIVVWDRTHQYCSQCGTPMDIKDEERAKVCPGCGFVSFPKIFPAIITAVVKDRKILLARAHRFPPGLYSVLAGFVESGESLEECLSREVREEVGIEVRNVRYFGSQPWPFPHSLMVAFTAEYAGGEINIDTGELSDADWFSPSNLPKIPSKGTIARELIEWFLERSGYKGDRYE